jgi:hypothetical protein
MLKSYLSLAGMTLCVACGGSSFNSGGGSSGAGGDGQAGTSATSGGATSSGGTSTGAAAGQPGTAGSVATGGSSAGGSTSTGGTSSAGSTSTGGSSAGTTSTGGSAGASAGGAGGSGGADCATLKTDYSALLEKARVCDSGSTDECSKSSTLNNVGCGCPVLVNAKSEFTTEAKAKYQAIQNAKCPVGPICEIACLAYTSAACTSQSTAAGPVFMCTGSNSIAN